MQLSVLARAGGIAIFLAVVGAAQASTIQLQSLEGYIHYGGTGIPKEILLASSPGYTSLLSADNLGSFFL